MRPLSSKDFCQHQLDADGSNDRQRGLRIAFENAERELPDEQDQRNQERRDETMIDAEELRILRFDNGSLNGKG